MLQEYEVIVLLWFFSVVDAVVLFIPHLLLKGHLCYPRMKLTAIIVMDASENNYLSSKSCCFSSVSVVLFLCCVAGFDIQCCVCLAHVLKQNPCFTLIQKMGEQIFLMQTFVKKSWEISIQVVNNSGKGMWKGEQ